MDEKNRIAYIDVAKGIGIILVVCGHVIGEGEKSFKYSNILHDYIYSFHMALFFIISGILLEKKYKQNDKYYLENKINSSIRNLLIPYFLWSIIYLVFSILVLDRNSCSMHTVYCKEKKKYDYRDNINSCIVYIILEVL